MIVPSNRIDNVAHSRTPANIPSTTVVPTLRLCSVCLQNLPQTDFRIVKKRSATRSRRCRQCHRDQERYRRSVAKQSKRTHLLYGSWSALARADRRSVAIDDLLERLIRMFGGSHGLAVAWHEAYHSATAVRRLRAVESLVFMRERFEKNLPALKEASDVQLQQAIRNEQLRAVAEMILTEPDTVAAIASQAGYTLTPVGCHGVSMGNLVEK